ncbi:tetratricopeptide repeat protein [Streptomyces sp. NPDC004135]
MAAGRDIGVAVTGDHNHLVLTRQVRSAYWEQVRRIAPAELVGRERELAELTSFCTADSGPAYAWWRAEAWAGKTALLSWFALHPPRGVRIVPFFVTARLGAQNDVVAYVDVVLEQLAELAGEDLPAHLTEATREAHLLHLYGAAARACAGRGERLVLLLDGLDEDRGVTTGAEAHSIAGLLPASPESGLRVLVAGRLNPPLPGDVPDRHPLRDPAVLRTLAPSPHAQTIRAEAERELKRLIEAGGLEYDLLALVTTANGGLTADDLSTLTGAVTYRVHDVLRTRAGRTFDVRAEACLLGHEELQVQARQMLGDAELDRYRDTLHAWADDWRTRGWPENTPQYLLRAYFRMVWATADTDRLVELAMDEARHDRMLEATGSDAEALTEVGAAAEHLAFDAGADLLTLLRLAQRRTRLSDRNLGMTRTMCRAWAELGRADKAVALARVVPERMARAEALAEVGGVLWAAGHRSRAFDLLAEVEAELRTDRKSSRRRMAAAAVLRVLAELGPEVRELADRVAECAIAAVDDFLLTDPVLDVVGYWAGTGRSEQAEHLARSLASSARYGALARIAVVLAGGGDSARAEELFEEVQRLGGDEEDTSCVVRELVTAGEHARAEALLATALARRPDDEDLCGQMVVVLAGAGDLDRAESWAARITEEWRWSFAVAEVACAAARAGDVTAAQGRAADVPLEYARAEITEAVAEALAAQGRYAEAERAAGGLTRSRTTDDALIRGALAHARSGHPREAERFLARVEEAARNGVSPSRRVWELAEASRCLNQAGHGSAARAVLADVERLMPPRPAEPALDEEEYAYDSLTDLVALRLAEVGELARAERLLGTAFVAYQCLEGWTAFLRGLVETGHYDRLDPWVEVLEGDHELGDRLRCEVALELAGAGRIDQALVFAGAVSKTVRQATAHAAVAEAMAEAGRTDEARRILDGLGEDGWNHVANPDGEVVSAAVRLSRAWRALGERLKAERAVEAAENRARESRATVQRAVRALVEARWHGQAERLVTELGGTEAEDTLVEALVAAGRYERAAQVAGLDDAPDRVSPRAAAVLAPVVAPERGRALAARLLVTEGWWLSALPAVARLEPEAVPWVVRILRSTVGAAEAPSARAPQAPPTAARTSAPS